MTFSQWVNKWISQMPHVGWGAAIVLALTRHISLPWAITALMAFAAIKEFIFDPLTEDHATQGNDLLDFAFWWVGAGLGALLTWV